jgi:hypothetical protein
MVATQHRARRQIRRVLHMVVPTSDAAIATPAISGRDVYPRYREAKKAALDFDFRRTPDIHFTPHAQTFKYHDLKLYWESHQVLSAPVGRAPPVTV